MLALQWVDRVAGPDPVRTPQDLAVDTSAPRRARLDLDLGTGGAQLVEQPVEGKGLPVRRRSAVVGRIGEVAVVVPLEVVDGVLLEQAQQAVAHLGVGRLVLEVQHLLRAPLQRERLPSPQDAVGMGPDRVGVDVDHLGLDPQAELHAQPAHVVDQGVQAVRPHVGVDGPVA